MEESKGASETLVEAALQQIDEVNTVFIPVDNAGVEQPSKGTADHLDVLEDDVDILINEEHISVDVVDMSIIYGPNQRGSLAKRGFASREPVLMQKALAYVTYNVSEDKEHGADGHFFVEKREVVPEQFKDLKGAILVALTGLLIRDREALALKVIEDGPFAFHGRVHMGKYASPEEAFPAVQDVYFSAFADDKEKSARWNLKTFGRLYGVVQCNAILSYIPLSNNVYGAGFYPGIAFLNHSCNPNAVLTVMPGKCIVQACSNIEPGDEVTISYKELPLDILDDNLVRLLHFDVGIEGEDGCRCEVCRAAEGKDKQKLSDDEDAEGDGEDKVKATGLDNVRLGLEFMWTKSTRDRIKRDKQLTSHVITMIRLAGGTGGAAAAYALRERYGHLLTFADGKKEGDRKKYCPELAFALGELYCLHTIHIPNQTSANYTWWANVYLKALGVSRMNLPHSTSLALLARAYACIMSMGSRDADDEKNQNADLEQFITSWVSIRSMHANMFGTTAYLMLACKAYPILARLVIRLQEEIRKLEQQLQLKQIELEVKAQEARLARGETMEQRELSEAMMVTPKQEQKEPQGNPIEPTKPPGEEPFDPFATPLSVPLEQVNPFDKPFSSFGEEEETPKEQKKTKSVTWDDCVITIEEKNEFE